MKVLIKHTDPVLLIGESELIASTAVCLLTAGHHVTACTPNPDEFKRLFKKFTANDGRGVPAEENLVVTTDLKADQEIRLVVAITAENEAIKGELLNKLNATISEDTIVAINIESIKIEILQNGFNHPERLIGLNWTEPVHTNFFMEVISASNSEESAKAVSILAKLFWSKDPYIVTSDGIRSRLLSAMAREASYLVDNGYASVDDIDRACRNDAGYYLPFCGNLRYMDLMGTYAYGMVMKDLNPDLSKDSQLPGFMTKILEEGGLGMNNRKGFYNYTDAEVDKWHDTMEKFGYQIRAIIEKYPFNYNKDTYKE